METPTTVKKMLASTAFEKAFVHAEEMVKDKPLSTLAISMATGAALAWALPFGRLFKVGMALYPIAQAIYESQKTAMTENIIKH